MAAPIETLRLTFELLSAATFGRGDGLPGLVDREVEHDRYGLPFLRGRTLRGLLAEEMEGLLFALGVDRSLPLTGQREIKWKEAADRLLGVGGRMSEEDGIMRVGDACLPERLRWLIAASVEDRKKCEITREMVLESLTAIRRQTAMTDRGAPEAASLRAMRVILRGTAFEARLVFDEAPGEWDKALLAATALAWRRAGTGRNRGRGRLKAIVESEEWMLKHFGIFQREVAQ